MTKKSNSTKASTKSQTIDIGIPEAVREKIGEALGKLLADTYTLYLKTHFYHWNVTGPMFQTLHLMFETQYGELALAVDTIAERIRSLGVTAPGSYYRFGELTSIEEDSGVPAAIKMIKNLVHGHEQVAKTARSIFSIAEKGSDESTVDLLTQRLQVHEKTAWMLRSLLEDQGQ
jgi:starvation-inducible DNA-binding protein